MSNLPLKPLVWTQSALTHTAESPLHSYIIRYDELEGAYLVDYYERMTGEHGDKFCKSVDDAKHWIATDHYPSKMQPYVKPDSITDIANWFQKAKPEPTMTDITTQIGCHYEEVAEMAVSMCRPRETEFSIVINKTANLFKQARLSDDHDFSDLIPDPIETLDALCDQIVTATGVAYMMGFDIEGALKEVIRSNNSKMVNGKFEFDDNGKIMKAEGYSKPDLTPFVKQGGGK